MSQGIQRKNVLRLFMFIAWLAPGIAAADIIQYKVPGLKMTAVLEGQAVVNQGGTVSYKHPRFGNLYFDLNDTRIHQVPTVQALFQRRLRLAEGKADELMEAARWALRRGQLAMYHEAAAKVLEVDPQHAVAGKIQELKRRMNVPLGDGSRQERELRELVKHGSMRIKVSPHFVLLHDTAESAKPGKEPSRADDRLRLLESVYEAFLLRFHSSGVELQIPRERMKVVLFNEHSDYLQFAKKLSPELQSASGFWDGSVNTSVFFDHGTTEDFKELQQLADMLQAEKARGMKEKPELRPMVRTKDRVLPFKDLVRLADTLQLLVQIERENNDINVVSHEATHQMAGNTGLLPQHVMVPTWAHEGLATYFESPNDAAWSGVGAVNEQRLDQYRKFSRVSSSDDIGYTVTDRIFNTADSIDQTLDGYGMAWALTHFLMERHFDDLMRYYNRLGEMPPDVVLNPQILQAIFNEVFGDDHRKLEREWESYMKSLKTDLEIALEEK